MCFLYLGSSLLRFYLVEVPKNSRESVLPIDDLLSQVDHLIHTGPRWAMHDSFNTVTTLHQPLLISKQILPTLIFPRQCRSSVRSDELEARQMYRDVLTSQFTVTVRASDLLKSVLALLRSSSSSILLAGDGFRSLPPVGISSKSWGEQLLLQPKAFGTFRIGIHSAAGLYCVFLCILLEMFYINCLC